MSLPTGRVPPLDEMVVRQVNRLLRDEYIQAPRVAQAARIIYGWRPVDQSSHREAFSRWWDLMQGLVVYQMSECHKRSDSATQHRIVAACNSLSLALTRLYSAGLELSEQSVIKTEALRDTVRKEAQAGRGNTQLLAPLMDQFFYDYALRYTAVRQLQGIREEGLELFEEWGHTDSVQVAEVAGHLDELRSYGVKPCVIDDGLLHSPDSAWVFMDGYDVVRGLGPIERHGLVPPLGFTHLADRRSIARLRPQQYRNEGEPAFQRLAFGFKPLMAAAIHADGSLTMDPDQNILSLERVFREAGVEQLYPLFQLIHLLRLYDLVVPVEVLRQRRVPAWPRLPANRQERKAFIAQTPELWRELVVPRLRILKDPQGLDEAFNREAAAGWELTERLTTKALESKEIVGFLRPLPRGHRASPQARGLALEERGIAAIPDGWTYVRNHTWGKGLPNRTAGHTARRRAM